MIEKIIKLHIGESVPKTVVECTEGDTMWEWHFQLFFAGARWTIPAGSSATFCGLKKDGNVFDLTATVASNEVVMGATEQITAVAGDVYCVVRVIDTYGKIIESCPVVLHCKPNPQSSGVLSDTVLSAYDEALQALGQAVADLNLPENVADWLDEHISQPTTPVVDTSLSVSGAAADAKKTGDEFTELKSALKNLRVENAVDFSIYNIRWVINAYGKWTYSEGSAASRSAIFEIPKGTYLIDVTANANANNVIAFLDTYNPVSGEACDFSATYPARIMLSPNTHAQYVVTEEVYFYALKTSSNGTDVTPTVKIYNLTDVTFTEEGHAADSKAVGDALYLSKNHASNYFSGLTYWRPSTDGFNSGNPFKLSDMPINSYSYVTANTFNAEGKATFTSGMAIWIACFASRLAQHVRNYFIIESLSSDNTNPQAFRAQSSDAGVTSTWKNVSGNIYNNSYSFTTYSNTYNVTATPTITTDTNAYLAPSGDTTDRTSDIATMLTTYGVCRLGKGDYYVSNLEMPAGTAIIGSGKATRILLSGTGDGFAIKMNTNCTVSNVHVCGATSNITLSSTVGGRHGILWQGDYTQSQTAPNDAFVDNVYISRFSGGGITCYDTGFGTVNGLHVTNAYIWNCNAGINISYWSEFNTFVNVKSSLCYYGAINNGGNNIFSACHFNSNTLGMLFDNSAGQSPNNTHGSIVACTFDHSDNNNGIGIKMIGCKAGEVFSDCQLFYSKIDITDCVGVQFNNLNTGNGVAITVTEGDGGGLIMFNNCVFKDGQYTISKDYNLCKFVNCWTRTGVAVTG